MNRGSRNMGRFFVGEQVLMRDEGVARRIFEGLVILQAGHRYDRGGTEYLAIGEQFDELPEGFEAPVYEVRVNDADGSVEFVREQHGDADTYSPGG